MSTFRSSARRGIATVSLIGALALGSTACGLIGGGASESDSDACGSGSGNGNGKAAARGIPSKYFNSVPGGLGSCDSTLKSA